MLSDKKYFSCTHCGFSANNRRTWCAKGCGTDYNEMIDVTDVVAATRKEYEEWVLWDRETVIKGLIDITGWDYETCADEADSLYKALQEGNENSPAKRKTRQR